MNRCCASESLAGRLKGGSLCGKRFGLDYTYIRNVSCREKIAVISVSQDVILRDPEKKYRYIDRSKNSCQYESQYKIILMNNKA